MRKTPNHMLLYQSWPSQDRSVWDSKFFVEDEFSSETNGAHLASVTRLWMQNSYGHFLYFVSVTHPEMLRLPVQTRASREIIEAYVIALRRSCSEVTIGIRLKHLRRILAILCPAAEWRWLSKVVNRIQAKALPTHKQFVPIGDLYQSGIDLLSKATNSFEQNKLISTNDAAVYRDGLMIALLAACPMLRRRALANLKVGKQLIKIGACWIVCIGKEDSKTQRAQEYPLSTEISGHIDFYLRHVQHLFGPCDNTDGAFWTSPARQSLRANTITNVFIKRTRAIFGFPISPQRFRHSTATTWSIYDPKNVRAVKDVLGHATFRTTEAYYIMAQTRLAGRAMADVIRSIRKEQRQSRRTGHQLTAKCGGDPLKSSVSRFSRKLD